MIIFLIITIIVSLTLFAKPVFAEPVFDINDTKIPQKIWPLSQFQHSGASDSLSEIIKSDNWQSTQDHSPSRGFTQEAVWVKFPINNSSTKNMPIRFFWHHAQIHEVDIYLMQQDRILDHVKLGTLIPIADRPLKTRMLEWIMGIPPGDNYEIYIRAASTFAISFRMQAGNPKQIESVSRFTENSVYLYIGVMIALALYNIPMALSAKNRAHWFYLAYIVFVTIYVISLRGFLFQFGFYDSVIGEQRIVFATVPIFLASSLLFAGEFLDIRNMPKFFHMGYWGFLTANSFLLFVALIPDAKSFLAIGVPLALTTILFTLISSGYKFFQGEYYAGFIFVGWLAVLFGIAGHQISLLIGVQTDLLGQESIKIGTALEATLFSWALGYRIKSLQRENELLEKSQLSALKQANEQLHENFQIESKSNRQKDDLLNLISQELKAPLDLIQSSLEFAKSNDDNVLTEANMEPLNTGVEYLRRNVSNIILLSEINAGELQPVPQKRALTDLISDIVLSAAACQRPGQQWQFTNNVSKDLIINIDDRLLQILIDNIVGNSFKFSPRGNVQLSLRQINNGDVALLEWIVEDDGIGIADDQLNEIFELFYQSKNEEGKHFDGMGLGLPLARKISDLLGGKLTISSQVNSGATVTFIHPVDCQHVDFNFTQLNTTLKPKVLIAEQNAINAQMLEKHMEKLGYITRVVDNGIKVVDACKHAEFQLIMINIHMPVMDGIETASIIRSKGCQSHLLAISTNDTNETRKRAIDAGFNGFIEKPIRFQKLQSKIKSLTAIAQ